MFVAHCVSTGWAGLRLPRLCGQHCAEPAVEPGCVQQLLRPCLLCCLDAMLLQGWEFNEKTHLLKYRFKKVVGGLAVIRHDRTWHDAM